MENVRVISSSLAPAPVALGLDARQLGFVGLAGMAAYALLHSPLPGAIAVGSALLLLLVASGLVWLRWNERSGLDWAILAAGFLWRRRRPAAPLLRMAPMGGDDKGVPPWARWLEPEPGTASSAPDPGVPNEPGENRDDEEENREDVEADGAAAAPPVVIPLALRLAPELEIESDLDIEESPPAPRFFAGATRRITFFSLNGGSGRTTIATELAGLLARQKVGQEKLKVALVDLDLRSSTTAVRLGVPNPTVWEYLASPENRDIRDYFVSHKSGLQALIGAPKPVTAPIDLKRFDTLLAQIESEGFHFIIFDVAADLGDVNSWVLNCSHDIFVVLTATASGIQDAYRTTEVLRRMGLRHKISYVANKVRKNFSFSDTMSDLGGRLIAAIDYDARIEDAENQHRLAASMLGEESLNGLRGLAGYLYPATLAAAPRRVRAGWWRRAG